MEDATITQLNEIKTKLVNLDENFTKSKEKVYNDFLQFKLHNKINSIYRENNQIFKINIGGELFELNKKNFSNCKFESILTKHLYKNTNEIIFIDLNPNYFYIITDFARNKDTESKDSLYDIKIQGKTDQAVLSASILYFFKGNQDVIKEINFNVVKKENICFDNRPDVTLPENLSRGEYAY